MSSRGRDKFKKFKPFIITISSIYYLFPKVIRKKIFESYRDVKGITGIVLRYAVLRTIAKKCGDNVAIDAGCHIIWPENLIIGDNVSIKAMCYIDAIGDIVIGSDVSIANMTTIVSASHNFSDPTLPIKDQGLTHKKTIINNNVWIGAKATILYGCVVGPNAIVGANSVVNRDVSSNVVVAGSPAKVIKEI